MNKNFLVVLLEKDLRELQLLTQGFTSLEKLPVPIIKLAKQKAQELAKNLAELELLFNYEAREIKQDEQLLNVYDEAESRNSDMEFLSEENSTKKDIPEIEEIVKEEPVEFVEDIEGYKIQDKLIVEPNLNNEENMTTNQNNPVTTDPAEVKEVKNEPIEVAPKVEEKPEEKKGLKTNEFGESPQENEVIPEPSTIHDVKPEQTTTEKLEEKSKNVFPDTVPVEETVKPELQEEQQKAVNTLNDSIQRSESHGDIISNQKVDDIRNAINIGDRFRFQRELFAGNGEVMNKTIAYLNQLIKYEEAESFLRNKFNWAKDNQHAEDFLQIVKRRYI